MEAGTLTTTGTEGRSLDRSSAARLPDQLLEYGLKAAGMATFAIIAFFFIKLYLETDTFFSNVGVIDFVFKDRWFPRDNQFGALSMVYGTLLTSVIGMAIGVPVAVGSALFVSELAPKRIAGPLSVMIELLAAVPSVVFGLWGVFVLIPFITPAEQWISDHFGFVPLLGADGPIPGPNIFVAGLILAIMIVPIVSAISREVMATVPRENREAALALGATRWEMIRMAVVPYARPGILGASLLGLGRALGETIAVVLVIGAAPKISGSIFDQGYTLAAVIANEFGEAASVPNHRNALIAAGLLLFVITLVVNIVARWFVLRGERRLKAKPTVGMAGGGAG